MTKLPFGNYELTLAELKILWGFMKAAVDNGEPPLPEEQDLFFAIEVLMEPES